MNKLFFSSVLLALSITACVTKGSQSWCDKMKDTDYSDWTASDAKTYASHCLTDSTTIGSDEWCENQKDKDFSQWTHEQTSNYVKACLLD